MKLASASSPLGAVKLLSTVGMFVIPLIVAAVLFLPMLESSSPYHVDWVNAYWLTLVAAESTVWPLWFFGEVSGAAALEPWFVYYGGNWFYLVATLSNLGLEPLTIYRGSYLVLAIGMALGVYVLSSKAEIPPWNSALLAVTALTVTYYLSNAYGRGAYTEFVFASLLPLFLGAVAVFWSATRAWWLAVSALIVAGMGVLLLTTHMASLIMIVDLVLFIVVLCILVMVVPLIDSALVVSCRNYVLERWRRLVALSLLVLAIAIVASPQLVPAILTATGTPIGGAAESCLETRLSTVSEVFRVFPRTSEFSTTPDLKVQTATWLVVWAGIAAVASWRSLSARRKVFLVFSGLLLFFCVAMTSVAPLCTVLPDFMTAYQFPYRFVTYVNYSLLLICGVILSSQYFKSGHGRLRITLLGLFVVAVTATAASGILQTRSAATYPEVKLAQVTANEFPVTWYHRLEFFRQVGGDPERTYEALVYGVPLPEPSVRVDEPEQANLLIEQQTPFSLVASIQCSGAARTLLNVADTRPLITINGINALNSSRGGLLIADTSSCSTGDFLRFTVEQVSEKSVYRWLIFAGLLVSLALVISAVALALVEGKLRGSQSRVRS